jgi:CheY-like chemotaxis protein
VEARSAGPGKGAEFVVRLPNVVAAREPSTARPAADNGACRRRRVLVVDDNQDTAESLALLLSLGGHEVSTAHDGEAALARVHADRPDVVLLDIGLPRVNGYEVARRLRARYPKERLALVAITGWGQEEDRRRASEAGFDRHLTKPIEAGVVQALIQELAP